MAARPAAEFSFSATLRRRRHDQSLSGKFSASHAGRVCRLSGKRPRRLRYGTPFPLQLPRTNSLLRMGRAYVAGCDRAYGNEGGRVSPRRPTARPSGAKVEGHHARRLPRAGKRDPPAQWNGGQDKRSVEAAISTGERLHLLRPLRARLLPAAPRAHKLEVKTRNLCELCANGANRRSLVAWRTG